MKVSENLELNKVNDAAIFILLCLFQLLTNICFTDWWFFSFCHYYFLFSYLCGWGDE